MFISTNVMIFRKVHHSGRRIHPSTSIEATNSIRNQHILLNRRDLHLFRHMIIMISIFVIGWSPIYILFSVKIQFTVNPIVSTLLTILCEFALLFDIIELYVYNREVRAYLKTYLPNFPRQ